MFNYQRFRWCPYDIGPAVSILKALTCCHTETMKKADFKKTLPHYQAKAGVFELVEVPPLQYLMVDGQGDPNTSDSFTQAIESLYPVAYRLKFFSKNELGRDYVVPPLQGRWWADDMAAFTSARDKSAWKWTLMIMTPPWLSHAMFADVTAQLGRKNPPPRLADMRLAELTEGMCVQTLHIGSFDDEAPVLAQLHDSYLPTHQLQPSGLHHEIYLSDFRRTAPAKLRTILRQPVMRASS